MARLHSLTVPDKPSSGWGILQMTIAVILYVAFVAAAAIFIWKVIRTKSTENRDRNPGDW
jgi:cytochrome bd-type quinol oxidase subunit 2